MRVLFQYIQDNFGMITKLTFQHIEMSFVAVIIAFLIGAPLGIIFTRYKKISAIGLNVFAVLYTIPTLALFGLMIPLIGMGKKAALTALVIYSLMPIIENVYAGIKNIDGDIIQAARGMGMSANNILFKIELPLSVCIIIAGLRTALVNAIGIATIASFIGAGGLGLLVYRGLSSVSPLVIFVGSVPILLLAILSDHILKIIENRLHLDSIIKRNMAQRS